jgi:type I restriction enzyme S subunit
MASDLKPYPEYWQSGLPWLDRIPAHWDVRRNARLFSQRNETGFPDLPILEVSLKTGVRIRDLGNQERKQVMADRTKYKRAVRGDIAYNMMRLWQGAVGVAPADGLVSPAYVVAKPYPDVDSRYYAYLFRTAAYMNEVNQYSHGIVSDRNRLYWDEFKQMPSVFPPFQEQTAIAAYLDSQVVLVGRFTRNKHRLMALLNEQKQAILRDAMTRGFSLTVSLRHGGVDWLGNVPRHWVIKRLKWVTRLQRGYDLPQDRRTPGPFPVVSSGGVIDTHSEARACGPGVVMGRYGSTDSVFFVDSDFWPHNTALFVTDFQGNNPRWCYYLLQAISKADHAEKSAVPGVDRKDLYDIYVAQPPANEQADLICELERRLAIVDGSIRRAQREIGLLREYRARLIADAVTGKLDVRHLAITAEEPEVMDASEFGDLSEEDAAIHEIEAAEGVAIGDE